MFQEYPELEARFYDAVYTALRSGVDQEFFLREMTDCAGPVLEVGAGTGRLFLEALRRGIEVYGIDASQSMLSRLRAHLPQREAGRIRLMDVRQLDLPMRFPLIVAPFRVFSHLITVEDQLQALDAISEHLVEGGRFLFDVFAPDHGMLANPPQRRLEFDGEHEGGGSLKRYVTVTNHPATQIIDVSFEYEWSDNGAHFSGQWSFPMRYYFRYELEHLIALSSLQLEEIFGDFAGGPIDDDSRDFVVICRN